MNRLHSIVAFQGLVPVNLATTKTQLKVAQGELTSLTNRQTGFEEQLYAGNSFVF